MFSGIIHEFKNLRDIFKISPVFALNLKIFSVKVGIAAAAVYYIKEQGVWRSGNVSVQNVEKIKESFNPYVQDIKSKIPIELPAIPETDQLSSLVKQSWNQGVLATFKFLSELPDTVKEWTVKGYDSAKEIEEIKKLIASLSEDKVNQEK